MKEKRKIQIDTIVAGFRIEKPHREATDQAVRCSKYVERLSGIKK